MKTTWYRVVYKDGRHSAWDTDKAWIEHIAETYGGEVETKVVDLP